MPLSLKHEGNIEVTNGSITVNGSQIGLQGLQGAQGMGPQGLQGSQGSTGLQGLQGFTGQGLQGAQGVPGPVSGTNYIYVSASGTDTQNATELQAAYNTAKTLSPSATNRITVVAAPGKYNFGSTTFTMNTQYIDLVSLDGNRSVIFNSSDSGGTISITANNVFVKGIDVETKSFTISGNLNFLTAENCKGGSFSFGVSVNVSGTFIKCIGGFRSFGALSTASGTFIDCQSGDQSFGYFATASGTFTNCTARDSSFGTDGIASGTFTNCTAGIYSFAGGSSGGDATGVFNNCTSGNNSFGALSTASGTFRLCKAGTYSFGGFLCSGYFYNCVAESYSFGYRLPSGIFINCIGGDYSFGNDLGAGSPSISGTFTNCTGGTGSWGQTTGTITGKLYYCRLTAGGSFRPVSGSGLTRYCINGNNTTDNQG